VKVGLRAGKNFFQRRVVRREIGCGIIQWDTSLIQKVLRLPVIHPQHGAHLPLGEASGAIRLHRRILHEVTAYHVRGFSPLTRNLIGHFHGNFHGTVNLVWRQRVWQPTFDACSIGAMSRQFAAGRCQHPVFGQGVNVITPKSEQSANCPQPVRIRVETVRANQIVIVYVRTWCQCPARFIRLRSTLHPPPSPGSFVPMNLRLENYIAKKMATAAFGLWIGLRPTGQAPRRRISCSQLIF